MSNACQHAWQIAGENIRVVESLDHWLGPTLALVRCQYCEQYALLYLVAWEGERLKSRVFAVCPLDTGLVSTYLQNISRDYCDLTRKEAETRSLINLAIPSSCLLTDVSELTVIASQPASNIYLPIHQQPWQDINADNFHLWESVF